MRPGLCAALEKEIVQVTAAKSVRNPFNETVYYACIRLCFLYYNFTVLHCRCVLTEQKMQKNSLKYYLSHICINVLGFYNYNV